MADQRRVGVDSLDEAIQNHFDGASGSPDAFNILVTGFGPFKEQFPINPSYEIAARLPSSTSLSGSPSHKINFLVHHPAIRVNYDTVRALTPQLYSGRRIDFTLHIGMAGSRSYYSIESQAHKRGYTSGDVDGKLCSYANDGRKLAEAPQPARKMDRNVDEAKTSDIQKMGEQKPLLKPSVRSGYTNEIGDQTPSPSDLRAEREAKEAAEKALDSGVGERIVEGWSSLPEVLYPGVDCQRVLRGWDAEMKTKVDLRVSNDAGRYLCEYIYWCSLAHRQLSDVGQGKVLFLHVPGSAEEKDVAKGVEVVLALCKTIVYEMIDGGTGKLELVQVDDQVSKDQTGAEKEADADDKSREDVQTDDKAEWATKLEKAEAVLRSAENAHADVMGKLKINDVGMVIDTEEDSDDDSEYEKIYTPQDTSGEMEDEDKDIKGETIAGMYPDGRKRRGIRGHTNRKNPRKLTTRWSDLQKQMKERKVVEQGEEAEAEAKAVATRAEAEAKTMAEAKTAEQKEEKQVTGKGKSKKEKAPRAPKTERIVIDKEYLGYVMAIPKDEQISD